MTLEFGQRCALLAVGDTVCMHSQDEVGCCCCESAQEQSLLTLQTIDQLGTSSSNMHAAQLL